MEVEGNMVSIMVIWRDRQLNVEVSPNCNFEELGKKLHSLTNVEPHTMRLLVPQLTSKTSKLITPFSAEHSQLYLQEMAIMEGKPVRMMGVLNDEIEKVSQDTTKPDLRILGFEEEERRLKQRSTNGPRASLKLPQGNYIFCDFRTLHIPGVELTPPPSEALRRMHMLACDPGIVAIMNKHRWRVGVMTEMAPEGYVGVSPVCLLGLNKNQGEEISLRLRTDDLKGFRKYQSIKKTLLHELAHMRYSEHDANFYALDKQLNHEAATLDWTKSKSHTLTGRKFSDHYEDYEDDIRVTEPNYSGQKLGGIWHSPSTARESSVAAAYNRFLSASTNDLDESQVLIGVNDGNLSSEDQPDAAAEPDPDDGVLKDGQVKMLDEPDPDDELATMSHMHIDVATERGEPSESSMHTGKDEPDPDDSRDEPDPDDSEFGEAVKTFEPDADDLTSKNVDLNCQNTFEPDPDDSGMSLAVDGSNVEDVLVQDNNKHSSFGGVPFVDDHMEESSNQELQIIEDPVAAICARLHKAIEMLRSEVAPAEATAALQTLFKIIRNAIDHPNETKYRRLRKANPHFQRNVASHKAAMELLTVVGFCEDVISDEVGRAETYLVLKRNDPGLLWLAKSSLELSIA